MIDVLVVSLGSTAGLRAADDELVASLRRAGAETVLVSAAHQRDVPTLALTDLLWARAARAAAYAGIVENRPRAVLYSTTTAALFWPRAGAIRFDSLAAANRPGRHGVWQRGREARRLREASVLVPWDPGSLDGAGDVRTPSIVVPVPVGPSGEPAARRDIAAITYARQPAQEGPRSRARRLARSATPWRGTGRRRTERQGRAGRALRRKPAARRVPGAPAPIARVRDRPAARGLRHRAARGARRRLPRRHDSGSRTVRRAAAAAKARLTLRLRRHRPGYPGRTRRRISDLAAAGAGRDRARSGGSRPPTPSWPRSCCPRCCPSRDRASASSSSQGRVLATSSAVSHARRAVATPQRITCWVSTPCASESIDDLDARVARGAGLNVVEVAAVDVAVDLEERASCGPRPR